MLASDPVATLNQKKPDLGIPRNLLKPHPDLAAVVNLLEPKESLVVRVSVVKHDGRVRFELQCREIGSIPSAVAWHRRETAGGSVGAGKKSGSVPVRGAHGFR
jgi:hypothetical protein